MSDGGGGVIEKLVGSDHDEHGGNHGSIALDAVAAAVAVDAARHDPELSRKAGEYFEVQRSLVQHQLQHYDLEHQLSIAATKRKAISDRLRISVQLFLVAVALFIGMGGLYMVWEASNSNSVIIESFTTPHALEEQGLSGRVVASSVLDALQSLQDATRGPGTKLATSSAWSSDVEIEVPETHLSIGEIKHFLHHQLGNDIRIEGDLVSKGEDNVELTVRGNKIPARRFEGRLSELDALAVKAAEYVYGRAQPAQFARYLTVSGERDEEAVQFISSAIGRATKEEEAELFNAWGIALRDSPAAVAKFRAALRVKPDLWKSWGNLVGILAIVESEEASIREANAMLAAIASQNANVAGPYMTNIWSNLRDYARMQRSSLEDTARAEGRGSMANNEAAITIADQYGLMHDFSEAFRWLDKADPETEAAKIQHQLLTAYVGLESGKPEQAVAPLEGFWQQWLDEPGLRFTYNEQPCMLGLAYGLTGALDKAEMVFKRGGNWAYCYAVRGDVLEHAGKLQEAEAVWAEGLRTGPSLSPVYLHRAISELKRGELKKAEADAAAAAARSPHWADTLKTWGDVLARQGRTKEALQKYDSALQYAPAWPALKQARAAAAQGKL